MSLSRASIGYCCSIKPIFPTLFVSSHIISVLTGSGSKIKLILSLLLGSYTYVVIWTSIEPCVGVTCACLPTLRPLLREILLKGESVGKIFDSLTNRTRLDQGIQLDSSSKKAGEIKPSHHTRWIDENPRLQPQGYLSGDTTVTSVVGGTDSERDDTQFAGINVRHDVHIEQSQFC